MTNLNERIAVEVMGWRHSQESGLFWYRPDQNDNEFKSAWNPSTDISDAWRVVGAMRERGINLRIESFPDGYEATAITQEGSGWAKTAPMAICLAALAAVGK